MGDMPVWKTDFPVSWADDHFVNRREFAKCLVWVSCASFAATAGLAAKASATRPKEPLPALKVAEADELPVGGAKVFGYPGAENPCILVRLEEDSFVAFAQRCTHLGCPVTYGARNRTLHCPCHEGLFSARDGAVLSGPPPRPLPRIELSRRGNELWAVGRS